MSNRITTYEDAFTKVLEMEFTEPLRKFVKGLEAEGHTEKSISFTIWKKQEKLKVYKHDERFRAILRNEVNKYSWKKDDPRWEEYWNKRNESERVRKEAERLREHKKELTAYNLDKSYNTVTEKEAFAKKPTGYVYFVQGCCGGAIKIGFSKNPEKRLQGLQTGYPDTLRILLLVPGKEKTEQYFHRKFELYRLNGEWFKPEKVILDEIKELKAKYASQT
jgi:hypothetical protein